MAKKQLILIIFFIIVAELSTWYGTRKIRNVAKKDIIVTKSEVINKKFSIFIRGNAVYSADGKPIVFKGGTFDYFRFPKGNTFTNSITDVLNEMKEVHTWGANTFQFYVNMDLFNNTNPQSGNYFNELQSAVEYGYRNGDWIIINPVNDVPWTLNGLAIRTKEGLKIRDNMLFFLHNLTKRFGNYKNVLFGIESEPKFIDNPKMVYERIDVIREYSSNPIIIPLMNFSGKVNMSDLIDSNPNIQNIIIDIHPYMGDNEKVAPYKTDPKVSDFVDDTARNRYPTIFGEFGGFTGGDFNSNKDVYYLSLIGQLAKDNNIGFLLYSLDYMTLSIFDKDGNLTNRGVAAKNLLEK